MFLITPSSLNEVFNIYLHWYKTKEDTSKSVPRIFNLSNVFWIICFCFHARYALKTHWVIAIKIEWLIFRKKFGNVFVQHPVRNVCTKFKIDCLSHFHTIARQVFTAHIPFPGEIPLTMKASTLNSLKTHFLIKLTSI